MHDTPHQTHRIWAISPPKAAPKKEGRAPNQEGGAAKNGTPRPKRGVKKSLFEAKFEFDRTTTMATAIKLHRGLIDSPVASESLPMEVTMEAEGLGVPPGTFIGAVFSRRGRCAAGIC